MFTICSTASSCPTIRLRRSLFSFSASFPVSDGLSFLFSRTIFVLPHPPFPANIVFTFQLEARIMPIANSARWSGFSWGFGRPNLHAADGGSRRHFQQSHDNLGNVFRRDLPVRARIRAKAAELRGYAARHDG